MIPDAVQRWLKENDFGMVISSRYVGGGCINNGAILETSEGKSFFLKTNYKTPDDMFAREFEGLNALRVGDGPRVPEPHVYGVDFILMENLDPGRQADDYWLVFGRQLAALHMHSHPQFGFQHDNYIGSTPQPNSWMDDGHEFFIQQRLLFQAHMARRRGRLSDSDVKQVEKLCKKLDVLIPPQPASLIHGDLWSGNATSDSQGRPAIIDPAVYYGWAEAELAMTDLFGSFPQSFYNAYQEVHPLDPGFRERYPIYNLYHLLNHLNLFGSGYLGQVQSILRRFSG